ncbi:hypothetical protein CKO44_15690 [Rubrivivax gelatinosus]|uniref:chemotaxis protein CheA n=1 Tax=Rubrivivax gelatinosus TaxID=28068 RepID=UPI00190879BA|nr:chemotaxis protein CheA [Rubrivivax gelatinosus]MBK1614912.1 hypothetical protein [Rubrivivax gelatinosus]
MSRVQSDQSFVAEALPAFISEAHEQIEALEQLLLQLEDAPDDSELLGALFRCAHTIKGSAGVFGLDAVVAFTHHVETLLERLRAGQLRLSPALSTLLLLSNDEIRALVHAAEHGQAEADDVQAARAAIVAQLQAASGDAPAPASAALPGAADAAVAGARRWQVAVRFGLETFRNGMDPLTILDYVRGLGVVSGLSCDSAAVPALDAADGTEAFDAESCHLGFTFCLDTAAPREDIERAFAFVRDDCTLDLREAAAAGATAPAAPTAAPQRTRDVAAAAAPAGEGRFIRVHADRLDEVINLLGELVIAGAGAAMLARETRQRGLVEVTQRITRLIEGVRNNTLQLRMVPIGDTFARFRRVVRDTASELGKDVLLELAGGDTELDKAVVERIADPLMHLVRNALDHGLETPAQRLAAGKPAQGRLSLSACHESGSILIHIRDDGRGIQRDKVLQRAWDRGLVEPGVEPPEDEILKLIFEPGFSTAETVTNLSGRGVGMDVVRRNIEALRGSVAITSEAGQGSAIAIRLPLTLAIIDGFLVGVGPSKFIFPLDAVVEVIAQRRTTTTADANGRSCVELRGQMLPVVDLRALYALDSARSERCSVVVLRHGSSRFGVQVDALLGQHQTVIKPLGLLVRSLRGISGSSILGTGEVALIFDVQALAELAVAGRPHAAPRPASPLSEVCTVRADPSISADPGSRSRVAPAHATQPQKAST